MKNTLAARDFRTKISIFALRWREKVGFNRFA